MSKISTGDCNQAAIARLHRPPGGGEDKDADTQSQHQQQGERDACTLLDIAARIVRTSPSRRPLVANSAGLRVYPVRAVFLNNEESGRADALAWIIGFWRKWTLVIAADTAQHQRLELAVPAVGALSARAHMFEHMNTRMNTHSNT